MAESIAMASELHRRLIRLRNLFSVDWNIVLGFRGTNISKIQCTGLSAAAMVSLLTATVRTAGGDLHETNAEPLNGMQLTTR